EYLRVRIFDEALQCVVELKAPEYHSELVKESIALGLEESPPMVEPVTKLLEFLFTKNILTTSDIGTGCLLYGSMLDVIAIDLPKAPNNFGEVMAKLVIVGCLDFNVVNKVLKKVEDSIFQRVIFYAIMKIIGVNPSGRAVLGAQAADVQACKGLLS
ncbi:Eukaryotic translation initiation factor isoform 4g-2, partial [Thalictrum thalictroides]